MQRDKTDMCEVKGCQQQRYYRSNRYCYFHEKQSNGLIPITDRKFYLQPGDQPYVSRGVKPKQRLMIETHMDLIKSIVEKYSSNLAINQDDLLQDVALKFMRQSHKVDESKKPYQQAAYIRSIIRHATFDYITAFLKEQQPADIDVDRIAADAKPKLPDLHMKDMMDARKTFVRKLPYSERYIWKHLIAAKEPKTLQEIADHLHYKSPGTVAALRLGLIKRARREIL